MSGSWVEDFNSFQSSQDTFGAEIPKEKGVKKPQTKKEVIENELKLLEWHKMANEAALKTALLQTKSMRDAEDPNPPSQLRDDAKWIKKVIEEEHVKPLEVTKDFVLEYDKNQTAMRESKGRQLDSKVQTMEKLRKSLEKKVDLKARTQEYRQWKRDFISKKEAVMMGKTLDDVAPSEPQTNSKPNSRNGNMTMSRQQSRGSQELATVLDSLNKLADLEQRISTLESNNQYDSMVGKEKGGGKGAKNNVLSFKPKRTKTDNGRTQLVYGIKEPSKRQGGGTFLTGGNDEDMYEDPRETAKRDRARTQAKASQGQKNLRSRITDRKAKQRDQAAGNKRHEAAMKELAKRRQDQAAKVRAAKGQARVARPSIGMSSGVRTKNKHMAEFQNIKSGFNRRKEDLNKKLRAPAVATTRRGAPPKRGVNRPVVGTRVASMSAPDKKSVAAGTGVNAVRGRGVRGNNNNTTGRAGGMMTQKGGTMTTRRTQNSAPSRRVGGAEIPLAPGMISVSGIGGIKQLRNNNNGARGGMGKSVTTRRR